MARDLRSLAETRVGARARSAPDAPRQRAAGILLHPTSLPGPFGIGDLGPDAHRFIDLLADSGHRVWQMLPLGPPGYGNSPYSARSAFAGNAFLLSPALLADEGLIAPGELKSAPSFPAGHVDFSAVVAWKERLFRSAFHRFQDRDGRAELEAFTAANASWLPDYVLFMALRAHHPGGWHEWPRELVRREPAALAGAGAQLAEEVAYHTFLQSRFAQQWAALRIHAQDAGVRLFGDIPIFVADDSADVWAHQSLFELDARGRPLVVAGVPPDYFSATGQLWGNPVYRWDTLAATGYRWWIERFRRTFELVDMARIDHFRGFEATWQVPAGEETAERGAWVPGPGLELFRGVESELGRLAIVAEDLGLITEQVRILRDATGYPGMRVLQFAFEGDPGHPFLPHNYVPNTVAYSGTHDNDTTRGWYASLETDGREKLARYLGCPVDGDRVVDHIIRLAYQSVADLAVIPMQDVLDLGSAARMNTPAVPNGNWEWRFAWDDVRPERWAWLEALAHVYGRRPDS